MIETRVDILCPPHSAVANGDPLTDDEIKNLTTNVKDCMQKLLLTLNARASALVKAERLDLAMQDAMAMIQLAPSSGSGYLRAGSIHFRRGHYASAIKIYDTALQHVPNSSPRHQLLVRTRAAAINKKNKRVDFISKLPLNIVTENIVPRILGGQLRVKLGKRCDYFDVCRTWRKRMAMAEGLEFEIGDEGLSKDGYQRISHLAPFMRTLTVAQPGNEMLSKITSRGKFESLQQLTIYESISRGPELLYSALRTLGNTLTNLHIEYGLHFAQMECYRLCDILDACPNLVSIRMVRGDIDMSTVTKTYPKLTTLDVSKPDDIDMVNQEIISCLLRHFPQLRVLKMSPVSGSDIFPAVDQHCPLLQQLILTDRPFDQPYIQGIQEDTTGLRVLCMATPDESSNYNEDDMVRYMMKHSNTMEVFEMVFGKGFTTDGGMLLEQDATKKVTFNNLREIQYPANVNDRFITFAMWMMQHAPQLESMGTVTGPGQQRVFQELMKPAHSHVKRIVMKADREECDEEEEFIQHHVDLGVRSKLQEIKVILSHSSPWLWSLPYLSKLTSLELCGEGFGAFEILEEFTEELNDGCPALEQLTLTNNTGSPGSFYDVIPMCLHRNLKRIIITANDMRGGGAYSFATDFRTLESLHLNLYRFDPSDIADLEKGSFKLVCTQRKCRPTFRLSKPAWKRHRTPHYF
ncbi:hypothetical protein O0I10_011556 [Lichtheimia ornata]|uniref:Uncharacterized protein n=1 Tax=Lichtheimia ornata TaxID=688661 RepID=A0AAD7UUF1_9FUNG|nr:uncharacterized protein O0I10_011556 [Lichtheimia ornata]KAJ8652817.1 hypothetical protein O0I10_011556 [Lichtheimia ornata]